MKKQYITPEIETIQLKIHGMLAASPPPGWIGEMDAPQIDVDNLFDSYVLDRLEIEDEW